MLDITLAYDATNAELIPFTESIKLTDVLSGEASTLELVLSNIDGRFIGNWAAVKGDVLNFSLGAAPPRAFAIDKVSVTRRPATVTWSATARPMTTRKPSSGGTGSTPPPPEAAVLNTRESWPAVRGLTLSGLLSRVASDAGMTHKYAHDDDPSLGTVARYQETAWALLSRQAARFGCTVNATADTLTIVGPKRASSPSPSSTVPVQATITLPDSQIEAIESADTISPATVRAVEIDPFAAATVVDESGDGDGDDLLVDQVGGDASSIVGLKTALAASCRIIILPQEITAGALVETTEGTFEVSRVEYARTPQNESMSLSCKGV